MYMCFRNIDMNTSMDIDIDMSGPIAPKIMAHVPFILGQRPLPTRHMFWLADVRPVNGGRRQPEER